MAHEKLLSIQDETVPQDLDLLERDVMFMLDQQEKEAANNTSFQSQQTQTSKFAPSNNNVNSQDKRTTPPSIFLTKPSSFLQMLETTGKQPKADKSRFMIAANAPLATTADAKPQALKNTTTMSRSSTGQVTSGLSFTALQLELGQIRYAKVHQYESTARLLKGLAQGDDAAEDYAAKVRPDLLKRLKAPGT